MRINANGVILVTSANLVEKKAKSEEIPIDNGSNDANSMDVSQEVCSFLCFYFCLILIFFFQIQFAYALRYFNLKIHNRSIFIIFLLSKIIRFHIFSFSLSFPQRLISFTAL